MRSVQLMKITNVTWKWFPCRLSLQFLPSKSTIPKIFNRKNVRICFSKNLIEIRNGVKETTFRFGIDQDIFQYLSMLKACIDLPVGKNKNCLIHQRWRFFSNKNRDHDNEIKRNSFHYNQFSIRLLWTFFTHFNIQ